MGGFGGYQIFGFKQQTEMARLMSSIMYQVSADEVLDLPDAVHTVFPVELSKSTREIYDQMEADFVCWVKEEVAVSAANALVKLLHLSQITGGFISDDEKKVQKLWDDTFPEKASALEEILEDLPQDEPVVVFSKFKMDVEIIAQIVEKTKRTCSRLTGDINELQEWQDGKTNILIANIQSGKEGIDLTRSRYAIYYSVGFSLGDYEQSLARVRRPGQKSKTVFYYHIVATKTVDEKVYKALEQKKDVIDHVLSEAKTHTSTPELPIQPL
jgi:SNF2 family DNA or RNA helicase